MDEFPLALVEKNNAMLEILVGGNLECSIVNFYLSRPTKNVIIQLSRASLTKWGKFQEFSLKMLIF